MTLLRKPIKTYPLEIMTTATKLRATITTSDVKRFLRSAKSACDKGRYVITDKQVIDGHIIRWIDVLEPRDTEKH